MGAPWRAHAPRKSCLVALACAVLLCAGLAGGQPVNAQDGRPPAGRDAGACVGVACTQAGSSATGSVSAGGDAAARSPPASHELDTEGAPGRWLACASSGLQCGMPDSLMCESELVGTGMETGTPVVQLFLSPCQQAVCANAELSTVSPLPQTPSGPCHCAVCRDILFSILAAPD